MPITNIGYPTSFSPTSITGCQLWLDAADSSSMTFSGANITLWNDKSGTGNNMTGTGAAYPTLGTTTKGKQCIALGGSAFFSKSSTTMTGGSSTFFILASATTDNLGLMNYGNNQKAMSFQLYYNGNVGNYFFSSRLFYNSNAICAIIENVGVSCTCYFNGTLNGSQSSVAVGSNGNLYIGSQTGNNTGNWIGNIQEVIYYNSALNATQQQQVEQYLAFKWGLVSQMGTSHPGYRPPPIPLSLVPYPTAIAQTFNNQYIYYTVPKNARITGFYMWGGGGPGGSGGQPGGGGAFLAGTLDASPGETLRVIVGKGGLYGTATQWSTMTDAEGGGGGGGGLAGQGGQGGGRSAIQKFISGAWTEVVTAGGGGSAGGNAGTYGGNAYYTGTSQSAGTTYGQGRVPTGGSASAGGLNTFTANVGAPWDGTQFTGGFASNAFNVSPVTGACGGGGGGGGYYGGGGGGRSGADTYGGGGGSSYYNATYVTGFSGSNGNANTAVATTIPGRSNGAGMGGAGGSTNSGSNGQVIITHSYAKTLFTFISNFMSTYYNLSGAYALANIADSVTSLSATPAYVWTVSVPSAAKGKNGILAVFFNLFSSGQFTAGQYFDYGVYVDGVSQMLGDSSGTLRYVQTALGTYALSSGGISLGANGLVNGLPLFIPVSFAASASQIQIGLKNSSAQMTPISSQVIAYSSNIITSSGTSNTGNFVPMNTFNTPGQMNYIVPTTCSIGTVTGVFIYCWGAGGGDFGDADLAGSGAFAGGYYAVAGGSVLSCVVGRGGSTGQSFSISFGGGGVGGSAGSSYSGGGFTGVFLSNAGGLVQSNAVVIAGAGGAGGQNSKGGGGGYPNGFAVIGDYYGSNAPGGTQTAGGFGGGATGVAGGALQGASGGGFYGLGAGGGWYGGGAWIENAAWRGGGGGSSYIGNINGATGGIGLTSGAVTSNGRTWQSPMAVPNIPGGNTAPFYYGTAGQNRQNGLLVIVPAVGTAATQIGVSAALYSG